MAIPTRTKEAILAILRSDIQSLNSNLNIGDHSVVYDIALYPAAAMGADLWLLADFVSRTRSLAGVTAMVNDTNYKQKIQTLFGYSTIDEVETLVSDMLDALVGNWNVTRKGAEYARGPVRFYATSNTPLTIEDGAEISTGGQNPINFHVVGGALNAVPQYEAAEGLYYVEVFCKATVAGASGNVGTNSISYIPEPIDGVIMCKNPTPTYGGADVESDLDLAERAQNAWQAWTLDTEAGLEAFFQVQPTVGDAYIAGPGDPLMRRNRQSAVVDVFVEVPPEPSIGIDVFAITTTMPVSAVEPIVVANAFAQSNMLMDGLSYTGNTIANPEFFIASAPGAPPQITYPPTTGATLRYYPNHQPVLAVQSVSGDVSGGFSFTLHQDTSPTYSGSTRARSYIDIDISGVTSTAETLTIQYTYDGAIVGLQNTINAPENNLITQDVLVRAGQPVYVNITGSVVSTDESEYPSSGIQATIESDLTILFNGGTASDGKVYSSYGLGQDIEFTDLLLCALSVDAVDRMDQWIVEVNDQRVRTYYTPQNSEYARLGVITWL